MYKLIIRRRKKVKKNGNCILSTMLIYKTMLYKYRSIDNRAKYTRLLNIDIYISDCPPIEKK